MRGVSLLPLELQQQQQRSRILAFFTNHAEEITSTSSSWNPSSEVVLTCILPPRPSRTLSDPEGMYTWCSNGGHHRWDSHFHFHVDVMLSYVFR
jgi:hypothetical protein